MIYKAYFLANGGSTYNVEPYEYTNLRTAIKEIKEIARAEHFQQTCNLTTVSVCDEKGEEIYHATLNGKRKTYNVWKMY